MIKTKTPAAKGSKWIRPEKREAVYKRDGYQCVYCGSKKSDGAVLTLDHIVPPPKGSNDRRNLLTACERCNKRKQKMGLHGFLWRLRVEGLDVQAIALRIRKQTKKLIWVRGRPR